MTAPREMKLRELVIGGAWALILLALKAWPTCPLVASHSSSTRKTSSLPASFNLEMHPLGS